MPGPMAARRRCPRHSRCAEQAALWRYAGCVGKAWRMWGDELPVPVRELHAQLLHTLKRALLPHASAGDSGSELLSLLSALAGARQPTLQKAPEEQVVSNSFPYHSGPESIGFVTDSPTGHRLDHVSPWDPRSHRHDHHSPCAPRGHGHDHHSPCVPRGHRLDPHRCPSSGVPNDRKESPNLHSTGASSPRSGAHSRSVLPTPPGPQRRPRCVPQECRVFTLLSVREWEQLWPASHRHHALSAHVAAGLKAVGAAWSGR